MSSKIKFGIKKNFGTGTGTGTETLGTGTGTETQELELKSTLSGAPDPWFA